MLAHRAPKAFTVFLFPPSSRRASVPAGVSTHNCRGFESVGVYRGRKVEELPAEVGTVGYILANRDALEGIINWFRRVLQARLMSETFVSPRDRAIAFELRRSVTWAIPVASCWGYIIYAGRRPG